MKKTVRLDTSWKNHLPDKNKSIPPSIHAETEYTKKVRLY